MVPGSVSFRLLSTDHVGIKRQLRQETRVETKSIPDGVLLKVLGVDFVADIDVRREPSPIGFGRYKEAGQVRPAGSQESSLIPCRKLHFDQKRQVRGEAIGVAKEVIFRSKDDIPEAGLITTSGGAAGGGRVAWDDRRVAVGVGPEPVDREAAAYGATGIAKLIEDGSRSPGSESNMDEGDDEPHVPCRGETVRRDEGKNVFIEIDLELGAYDVTLKAERAARISDPVSVSIVTQEHKLQVIEVFALQLGEAQPSVREGHIELVRAKGRGALRQ